MQEHEKPWLNKHFLKMYLYDNCNYFKETTQTPWYYDTQERDVHLTGIYIDTTSALQIAMHYKKSFYDGFKNGKKRVKWFNKYYKQSPNDRIVEVKKVQERTNEKKHFINRSEITPKQLNTKLNQQWDLEHKRHHLKSKKIDWNSLIEETKGFKYFISDLDKDHDLDIIVITSDWSNDSAIYTFNLFWNDNFKMIRQKVSINKYHNSYSNNNKYEELIDVDGDGDLDFLIKNPYEEKMVLFQNNGTNNLKKISLPMSFPKTKRGYRVYTIWKDIDNDGDLDLLFRPSYDTGFWLYKNHYR